MKLEPKHLAPYLPYNLKAKMLDYQKDYVGREYDEIIGIHQWSKNKDWCLLTDGGSKPSLDSIKPLLRPADSLTDGEKNKLLAMNTPNFNYLIKSQHVWNFHKNNLDGSFIEYCVMQKLFEWHIDVFGLINAGLAVEK